MGEPSNLLLKLSRRLFAEGCDRDAFVAALTNPQPYPTAILWIQPRPVEVPFAIAPPLSWQPAWVDRRRSTSAQASIPCTRPGPTTV